MTDLLEIDGWNVAVRDGQFEVKYTKNENWVVESYHGHRLSNTRYEYRRFDGKTPLLSLAEQEELSNLFLKQGHLWSFEGKLYSSKGLWPELNSDGSLDVGTGHSTTDSLEITSNGEWQVKGIVNDRNWGSEWTVILHFSTDGGATYERIGYRSGDGASDQWRNGTQGSFTIENVAAVSLTTGVTFKGKTRANSNSVVNIDNVMILPWDASDAQMTAWTAASALGCPFPNLLVQRNEDVVAGDTYLMAPDQGKFDHRYANGNVDEASISFSLIEAEPNAEVPPIITQPPGFGVDVEILFRARDVSGAPEDSGLQGLGTMTASTATHDASGGPDSSGAWNFPAGNANYRITGALSTGFSTTERGVYWALIKNASTSSSNDMIASWRNSGTAAWTRITKSAGLHRHNYRGAGASTYDFAADEWALVITVSVDGTGSLAAGTHIYSISEDDFIGPDTGGSTTSLFPTSDLYLGAYTLGASSYNWDGDIAEIGWAATTTAVAETRVASIIEYVNSRYGLSLLTS